MSSLLQQEVQVDMQKELLTLADDLESLEVNLRSVPGTPLTSGKKIAEPKVDVHSTPVTPGTSDIKPTKPKVKEQQEEPKVKEQQEEPRATEKNAQRRSKSVSYLLTHADVDEAKKKKTPKVKSVQDAVKASADGDHHATVSKNPLRFRAAPEEPIAVLSQSPEVLLHIYEVGELSPGVQKMLATVLGKSAFHVGVEVYGEEHAFGQHVASGMSGITSSKFPKSHAVHRYKETLSLGRTSMSPDEVRSLLTAMASMWLANEYHPLRRNCVNFAEELCHRLDVNQPPAYIGALSRGLKNFLLV